MLGIRHSLRIIKGRQSWLSSTTLLQSEEKCSSPPRRGFFQGLFGSSRPALAGAVSLLSNCKDVSDRPEWYNEGLIGTEFRSRHSLIMLHCWMLHKRLLSEGSKGKTIQEALFDELWDDTGNRIRNVGVNELSINKHLKEVQGYSFRQCLELDEAVAKEHPDEVLEDIGGVVWRFNYLRSDNIEPDHVMKVADYVFREYTTLKEISGEAILEGRVAFGPLPEWTGDENSRSPEIGDTDGGDSNDSGEWKRAISNDGSVYWWNTTTRETSWTKPI